MEQDNEQKIDGHEAVFMILVCLFFDGMDVIATLFNALVGAGEFIKFFINVVASSILYPWVILRGVSPVWTIAGGALELIPVANILPMRTVTMGITIYLDRHPEQTKKVEVVGRIVRPKKIPTAKINKTTNAI